MALLNYNLRQITNNSIRIMEDGSFILNEKVIETEDIAGYKYFIFTSAHFGDVEGAGYGEGGISLVKFSYICEPNAFSIPIYVGFKNAGDLKKIVIGKTGMFEIQTEKLVDKENDEVEETLTFYIDKVYVPVGFKFSIDYIIPAKASE